MKIDSIALVFSPGAGLSRLLALAAGAVTVLAFAPFGLSLLAPVALALLFRLLMTAAPLQAFVLAWFYGFGLMGFGVFWLRNSIEQFGGVNLPLALFFTLGFAALIAMFFAFSGWFAARLRQQLQVSPGLMAGIVLPMVWLLVEWLRSWLLTGFPWLSLGYSQIDTPLSGYAPWLGVYGVSLAVAATAGLLSVWRNLYALPLVLIIWVGGWQLQDMGWSRPAGEPFEVSLIQGSVPQQMKWQPEQLDPTLELYLGLTQTVPDSRLVIWPETAVPAFSHRVEDSLLKPLHKSYSSQGRDLLLGIPVRHTDGSYYNAMLNLGSSGRDTYTKQHLVPFGEYMPLRALLEPLIRVLNIPMSDFSANSDRRPLLQLAGHAAGISICYEDAFGSEIINAMPEAAFLVNASNDAWFGDSLAPHQHLQMARMRALETERYLLRATNNGVSAIIGPDGELLDTAPQFQQAILTRTVQPLAGATPFANYGNLLVLAISLVMLSVGLLWAYSRRGVGG